MSPADPTASKGPAPELRELVLVGAGHAHIQVLRSFAMKPPPAAVRLTLVVDTPVAVYSGMVPGFVAGQYRAAELEIDALPLARRAGARVVLAAATGIDPRERKIRLTGRPPIPYDLASIDIGSSVAGLDLPGIREHALATRPIGRFADRVAEVEEAARRKEGTFKIVVVGGGAAGVELAATFQARLSVPGPEREGGVKASRVEVTLVHDAERLLPGYSASLTHRVERALEGRGIVRRPHRKVVAAEAGRVDLDDGSSLPCDALVWATGAVAHDFFRAGGEGSGGSGLRLDERGFVLTRPTLQVVGYDNLFAVGDCATLGDHPETPKAGVYAVRQGPVLSRNLRAALEGSRLSRYRPQSDFLALLNLGDGSAIGAKWGAAFAGRWVMALKDRIDRRFMNRFQLLEGDGRPGPALRGLPAMADPAGGGGAAGSPSGRNESPMFCGGCAAKLGRDSLLRTLARVGDLGVPPEAPEVLLGWKEGDDVAAFRVPGGDLIVASVDGFRAFSDDLFLVGEVAARNAVSDLQAKGVAPRWAQALVTLPLSEGSRTAEETLFQLLAGARSVFDPLGVRLLGGHTSRGLELQVGFSVQGVQGATERGEEALLRRSGPLTPGQALVLTRPLGTGVIFHADMAGRARGPWLAGALAAIRQGHGAAPRSAREEGAVAATDVTGFGLAGHLAGMLDASACSAQLELGAIPALAGALDLLKRGERSTFHDENARLRRVIALEPGLAWASHASPTDGNQALLELLFDPQTAGGLLLVSPGHRAEALLHRLRAEGLEAAARIGEVKERREDGAILEIVVGDACGPERR